MLENQCNHAHLDKPANVKISPPMPRVDVWLGALGLLVCLCEWVCTSVVPVVSIPGATDGKGASSETW